MKISAIWMLSLLLFVLVSMVISRFVFNPNLIHIFSRYVGGDVGGLSALQAPKNDRPRLQVDEHADLANYNKKQSALLNQYSNSNGVIRIPIEAAMKQVVDKGLPARKAAK